MPSKQELHVQEKQEVAEGQETTVPARYYVPQTDIFEAEDALTVVMEVPGVTKDTMTVDLENDQLRIEGRIDFSSYEGMEPVYTEYNVGHYQRTFSISNKIDRDKISADLADGVLTLVLPKAEEMKPHKIKVN
ncbi:MAG: Hsp20/alpha crystallin family protein [Alphaproteobacteria bacterium]|nr:Hsp20/alpha crystallin family protein [Alphaproteobacteria bacterium]